MTDPELGRIFQALSTGTALDGEIWEELQSPYVSSGAVGCLALASEAFGAAAHMLKMAYTPIDSLAPFRALVESMHSLHRGSLLFHLSAWVTVDGKSEGSDALMQALASDDIMDVLRLMSATAEDPIFRGPSAQEDERDVPDAIVDVQQQKHQPSVHDKGASNRTAPLKAPPSPSTSVCLPLTGPDRNQAFSHPGVRVMMALELGSRAMHLSQLHLTRAMGGALDGDETGLAPTARSWQELLRLEVTSLYIRGCSELSRNIRNLISDRRKLMEPERIKMRFCSTVSHAHLWQQLLLSGLLGEILSRTCGADSTSSWCLFGAEDVLREVRTERSARIASSPLLKVVPPKPPAGGRMSGAGVGVRGAPARRDRAAR